MKIGLGLYRDSLTADNFQFAVQAGATHIVAHMTNYFRGRDPSISSGDDSEGPMEQPNSGERGGQQEQSADGKASGGNRPQKPQQTEPQQKNGEQENGEQGDAQPGQQGGAASGSA